MSERCLRKRVSVNFEAQTKNNDSKIKRQLAAILKKADDQRTSDESQMIRDYPDFVHDLKIRSERIKLNQDRMDEVEDDAVEVSRKVKQLFEMIKSSKQTIFYTGAGISTSAKIPDYRGPNGIWTQLKNFGKIETKSNDIALSTPTYTHMAIKELERTGIVKHVVSQNCDGLHFRSGLTMNSLSEIHGNMFVEFCSLCKHNYIRDFDVTERTSFRRHRTGRRCNNCFTNLASSKSDNKNYPKSSQSDRNNNNSISNIDSNDKKNINSKTDTEDDDSDTDNNADQRPALYDSIVHFGEKSHFGFPYNWEAAVRAVDQCDLIVCLGSSLKVLRHYKCLWPGRNRKVSLVIVNLQWTSKDKMAQLKINAKCDLVMRLLSELFEIKVPSYSIDLDPLQQLYRPLDKDEEHTCNRHHIFQQPPLNTTFSNIKCERIRNEAHTVIPDQEVPSTSIPSGWFGKGIKRKK